MTKEEKIKEYRDKINADLQRELQENSSYQKALQENPSIKKDAEELQEKLVALFADIRFELEEQNKK